MLTNFALLLSVLNGCSNHCQLLCENMAEYARNECDINVPEGQVDDCIDKFADSSSSEEDACETYSNIETEEGWTCEIVGRYYDN